MYLSFSMGLLYVWSATHGQAFILNLSHFFFHSYLFVHHFTPVSYKDLLPPHTVPCSLLISYPNHAKRSRLEVSWRRRNVCIAYLPVLAFLLTLVLSSFFPFLLPRPSVVGVDRWCAFLGDLIIYFPFFLLVQWNCLYICYFVLLYKHRDELKIELNTPIDFFRVLFLLSGNKRRKWRYQGLNRTGALPQAHHYVALIPRDRREGGALRYSHR